ncbi:hypothetical protein SKAU_G00075280 [Synaphobranchus kaupii]|uniref:E3 ubiquitin-protein ligase n=1 Tax=Synaphobranchus kaupii TaxID=118154 RepID=A0A9Q1G8I0_SYNKA|nr:hypothetical protein SKAU_G00075280 [Synaphobranchus kaupii]
MSKISKAGRAVGIYGCFTETGDPSEARATAAEGKTCPLCMKPLQKKQRLICTHAFCEACLKGAVEILGLQCPVCLKALRVVGDQPEGQMTVNYLRTRLGDCVSIMYNILNGLQTVAHPNPGKPFTGIQTTALLPNSPEGQEVLKLLQKAFEQKLVFTVAADRVVFADIPHTGDQTQCSKTVFLKKVRAVLRTKGIE